MTSIIENLIRRQAAHVKESGSKIAAAEHLEAAAKLLRLEASASPVKLDFKAEARNKEGRLAKFAAAMKGDLEKQTRAKLSVKGWSLYQDDGKIQYFANHSHKGCKLIITDGKFSVVHGNLSVHPETSIKLLDAYLNKK